MTPDEKIEFQNIYKSLNNDEKQQVHRMTGELINSGYTRGFVNLVIYMGIKKIYNNGFLGGFDLLRWIIPVGVL